MTDPLAREWQAETEQGAGERDPQGHLTVAGPSEEVSTLLPCPFCGGEAQIVTRNVEPQGDPWYGRKDETFVLCECGACLFDGSFHEGFYDAENRAIAAWNRRTPTERSAAPTPLTGATKQDELNPAANSVLSAAPILRGEV